MTDKDGKDTREARLKKALRDNLKRRKQAARRSDDDIRPGEGPNRKE